VVHDHSAWQRLPPHGISSIYLPPMFAPALMPAYAAILEPFYMGEFRLALEKCSLFMEQLTAIKHQLGPSYDTTVRMYCILRAMLQIEMGYNYYPTDLPIPGFPHLEPVPPSPAGVTDEYIVHRLIASLFDPVERCAAVLGEYGWNCELSNKMVKDNIGMFKREMARFKLDAVPTHPLPEVHVCFCPL